MTKSWQPYAHHVLEAFERIGHIQQRGDLTRDQVLYDATLRNLQTLSEATQQLLHLPALVDAVRSMLDDRAASGGA